MSAFEVSYHRTGESRLYQERLRTPTTMGSSRGARRRAAWECAIVGNWHHMVLLEVTMWKVFEIDPRGPRHSELLREFPSREAAEMWLIHRG